MTRVYSSSNNNRNAHSFSHIIFDMTIRSLRCTSRGSAESHGGESPSESRSLFPASELPHHRLPLFSLSLVHLIRLHISNAQSPVSSPADTHACDTVIHTHNYIDETHTHFLVSNIETFELVRRFVYSHQSNPFEYVRQQLSTLNESAGFPFYFWLSRRVSSL